MKTLELENYGVAEMSKDEIQETGGGSLLWAIAINAVVCVAFYGAFMAGYNAAQAN